MQSRVRLRESRRSLAASANPGKVNRPSLAELECIVIADGSRTAPRLKWAERLDTCIDIGEPGGCRAARDQEERFRCRRGQRAGHLKMIADGAAFGPSQNGAFFVAQVIDQRGDVIAPAGGDGRRIDLASRPARFIAERPPSPSSVDRYPLWRGREWSSGRPCCRRRAITLAPRC